MGPHLLRTESAERSSATLSHCQRVAALAIEVGRCAGIPSGLQPVLEQAAQLHHSLDLIHDPTPLGRLAWDVLCANDLDAAALPPLADCAAGYAACEPAFRGLGRLKGGCGHDWPPHSAVISRELQTVLAIFHHSPGPDAPAPLRRLAGILTVCNLLDEQIEALEFESRGIGAILDEIQGLAAFEGFDPALVDHLRHMQRPGILQVISQAERLPVEVRTARRVFRALWQEREYDVQELEALAARDPVLAGSVIGPANSALYNPARKLSSVAQAISYVGSVAARRVMLAAVLRPMFASAGLKRLWSHSVNSAQYCSALAGATTFTNAGEGLVLGLLHDIGALATEFLDRETQGLRGRLQEGSCPATYTERLILGADHGEIGAAILTQWGFPEHLVEAVRFHHQPERTDSELAAFLYLAEFWSGVDEDLPSFFRVEHCLARTGLTLESLSQVGGRDSALNALRSVA